MVVDKCVSCGRLLKSNNRCGVCYRCGSHRVKFLRVSSVGKLLNEEQKEVSSGVVVPELITVDMVKDLRLRGLGLEAENLLKAFHESNKKMKKEINADFNRKLSAIKRLEMGVTPMDVIRLKAKEKREASVRKPRVFLSPEESRRRNNARCIAWYYRNREKVLNASKNASPEIKEKRKKRQNAHYYAHREEELEKKRKKYKAQKEAKKVQG